jgi:phage tail P2-like protein
MKLTGLDLLKLQTGLMREDLTTQAMSNAIGNQLRVIAAAVDKCLILSRVDKLSEEVLDQLAVELHVDWYDAGASLQVKREIIRNSGKVHQYLGTPYAVEQVVQDYFGDGEVEEWFEYDGDPFYFRVVTVNTAITGEQAEQFARAVEKVKNARSRLESVIVAMTAESGIYFGMVIHTGDQYTIRQVA